uniref:Uncharacterized protein n=1 Tax=Anguilla anguilla TaxID=7936 RepID=A0A0E9PQI6_ANGAN
MENLAANWPAHRQVPMGAAQNSKQMVSTRTEERQH